MISNPAPFAPVLCRRGKIMANTGPTSALYSGLAAQSHAAEGFRSPAALLLGTLGSIRNTLALLKDSHGVTLELWAPVASDTQAWGMVNLLHPKPASPAFGENDVVPERNAGLLSKVILRWLSPFLKVGFSRPLQREDFWKLPDSRLTQVLTEQVEGQFYTREPLEAKSFSVRTSRAHSDNKATSSTGKTAPQQAPKSDAKDPDTQPDDLPDAAISEQKDDKVDTPAGDRSLLRALHRVFWLRWWIAGALRLVGTMLQTTTPLVTREILKWLSASYAWHRLDEEQRISIGLSKPQGVGYGIGLAFALFVMQQAASMFISHAEFASLSTGLYVRAGVVGTIFRKSLRLSGRARVDHSVGQITTMISTDATRLETSAAFFHQGWISPIQMIVGIALLIYTLGYSALVGVGVLLFGMPVQGILVFIMYQQRQKGVHITDQRMRLTSEVLQGIRLLKYYAWENVYARRIIGLREREMRTIRKSSISAALLVASMEFVPVLASILSFVTYSLTDHDLTVATIFTSLQYLNVIREPLILIPFVLHSYTDAAVALGRIQTYLNAEELPEPYQISASSKNAVEVNGDFRWETTAKELQARLDAQAEGASKTTGSTPSVPKDEPKDMPGQSEKVEASVTAETETKPKRGWFHRKEPSSPVLPVSSPIEEDKPSSTPVLDPVEQEDQPFALGGLTLTVPKGAFVAIVGRIGSGKSSLLQSMVGEMRKTRGTVQFGGSVAYVPQSAWIMNATLRDNILFGRDEDESRFNDVLRACCLEHDLEVLPHGAETEIGERGINLSGGQKARVSLARAVYSDSDVVLLDDCLSAVDAHTGKALVDRCLLGTLADKTRILVTHALHVLDKADYIYVMDEGRIVEEGTFNNLRDNGAMFSRLITEYGSQSNSSTGDIQEERLHPDSLGKADTPVDLGEKKAQAALMQAEERATGAVSSATYLKYLKYAGGLMWAPVLVGLLIITQGATVANNLFLGFWTGQTIKGFGQAEYMAVYGALGVAQAIFAFLTAFAFSLVMLAAGLRMFKTAFGALLHSPVSFFDTTPMGRIIARVSKDQDTVDNELFYTTYLLSSTLMSILGTVVLVFYAFPYLGIIFAPLGVLYYAAALYYRRTSVETKRIDSLMRSALYASYSETLTGLATVRAYRSQGRFVKNADERLDLENRAGYMTVAIQTWLGLRLEFFGNLLLLGIGLFAAGQRNSVNPAKVGVVLSYSLSITRTFSAMVQMYAENEQNMNAVERVLTYAELRAEGARHTPQDPPPEWPAKGEIRFNKVSLTYREGLPLVLKSVDFHIHPGEKVGVVGRTGAGKSSLLQALFRIVEIQGGKVEIDGVDIRNIGLDTLRERLALVPQDSVLFFGTIRENLDPQATRTDAELLSALQRSWLLPRDGSKDSTAEAKFSLEASVNDEGSNYSAGEKQLIGLCRALVKNSQVIVLDEATSNVDVETDAKLQKTIQTEFATSTLICVAHRLNTIVFYDRILVMDAGSVAEFDTPLNLYDQEGSIFRSLCNEASLSREDILRIRASVHLI